MKELDALIGKFLADTGAMLPIPNPNYDPSAVAAAEGKGKKSRKRIAVEE